MPYLVSTKEYHRLRRERALLEALQAGGVDNWVWYSEAYREYLKEIKGQPWDEGHADDLDDEDAHAR